MQTSDYLSDDRPIQGIEEDTLNRSVFAGSLATALDNWHATESLVVALCGRWDDGKTSLANMTIGELRKRSKSAYRVIQFNPWQWASQSRISHAFFMEVSRALGNDYPELGQQWRVYGSYLRAADVSKDLLTRIAVSFFGSAAILMGAFAFLADTVANFYKVPPAIAYYCIAFAAIIGILISYLWWDRIVEIIAALFSKSSEVHHRRVEDLRNQIRALMQGHKKKKTIVVVDDIDRLEPDQIREIFQLIKANSDFPGIVYLCLFQRDIVECQLSTVCVSGREYLKKIIQVTYDVPSMDQSQVQKQLFLGLDKIIERDNAGRAFSQARWSEVFLQGISVYFKNIRDVKRFLPAISLASESFLNNGSYDANFIDVTALEVLRVFEPSVYHQIPVLRKVLTRAVKRNRSDIDEKDKVALEALVGLATETRQPNVRKILQVLFPSTIRHFEFEFYTPSGDEDDWYKALRVCHPEVFDRYFQLVLPTQGIRQADIDAVLAELGAKDRLVAVLNQLADRGMLDSFLDRFDSYKTDIPSDNCLSFITSLFDVCDRLSFEEIGRFEIRSDIFAVRIVWWALKKLPGSIERVDCLCGAMARTSGVFLPVSIASEIEDEKESIVDASDMPSLTLAALEIIRSAAVDGRLQNQKRLGYLLYRWMKWGDANEVREWVEELVHSHEGSLHFLRSKCGYIRSFPAGMPKTTWKYTLSDVEKYIDVDAFYERVKQIPVELMDERDKELVAAYEKALKRRAEGLPESDWEDYS